VREIWFYERGSLKFFSLRGARGREHYVSIPRSTLLPGAPIDLLLACMREPSQTAALRVLRTQLRPSGA
jgi:hypothetical protein